MDYLIFFLKQGIVFIYFLCLGVWVHFYLLLLTYLDILKLFCELILLLYPYLDNVCFFLIVLISKVFVLFLSVYFLISVFYISFVWSLLLLCLCFFLDWVIDLGLDLDLDFDEYIYWDDLNDFRVNILGLDLNSLLDRDYLSELWELAKLTKAFFSWSLFIQDLNFNKLLIYI